MSTQSRVAAHLEQIERENPAVGLLEQIEREKQVDRALVDALIRYKAVAVATGNKQSAKWADNRIDTLEQGSRDMEVARLLVEIENYTAACKLIGYDSGFSRGSVMREELTNPQFYVV